MNLFIGKIVGFSLWFALCGDLINPAINSGSQSNQTINIDNLYACPRCRRNQPKGPKKGPTPPGPRSGPAGNFA